MAKERRRGCSARSLPSSRSPPARGKGGSGPDVGTPRPQLTPNSVLLGDIPVDAPGFRDERIWNVDRTAELSYCCATWRGQRFGVPIDPNDAEGAEATVYTPHESSNRMRSGAIHANVLE